jgi:hypothetical protein
MTETQILEVLHYLYELQNMKTWQKTLASSLSLIVRQTIVSLRAGKVKKWTRRVSTKQL